MSKNVFTTEQALEVGSSLGINWDSNSFDVEQFRHGMDIELEHGTVNQPTNITNDDPILTGKIALTHLLEYPDYYDRLDKLELAAEAFFNQHK